MLRTLTLASLLTLAGAALAQTQKLPADLASLPQEIKTLQWQPIDPATLSPLEQARSLLLLDHALSELSANATSEADLMSAYIEQQKLGTDFANTPPPPPTKQLQFTDAQKVAIALLRGPMSTSYYATELGDASSASLTSYVQMYQRTCQRKWSAFDEARQQVRAMASYLGNAQKLPDYDAWATAESARRQKAFDQQSANAAPAAQQPAAAAPAAPSAPSSGGQSAQMAALEQQNQQLSQALGSAEYQQQQAAPQQSSQSQQSGSTATVEPTYAAPAYGVYGGYGAYTAYGTHTTSNTAAAGAYAGTTYANNQNAAQQQKAAAAYHAQNSTWNRSSSYNGNAQSQTEQRMNGFHGVSGGGSRR